MSEASSEKRLLEKATPEVAFCFVLNRLLEREAWARERLAPFAGACVELRAPLVPPLRFTLLPGGRVAAGGPQPELTLVVKPEVVAALGKGEEAISRAIEVSGNARLAAEAMQLARYLRWDIEEDLARVLGDAAAHRLVETARAFGRWQLDTARRLAESFAAYATDEARVLVRRADLEAHRERVAALRDAIERLARRLERLG
ncbi:MAG: ubiquinone biosynthesis accessory factor UbiJ [Betaproteobacteria bacterium]